MAQVKVYYDRYGNTLTVWFGEPAEEYEAEEVGDDVILLKDQQGNVIGFEKLNFSTTRPESLRVAFEAVSI